MTFVFIHPPRTAGTSVRKQIGYGAAPKVNTKHAHYRYIAQRVDLSKCYVFTSVRNPYHRAVSLWGMWGENSLPFGEWMLTMAAKWDDLTKSKDPYIYAMDDVMYHHASPQMFWIEKLSYYNKIVRYETRAEDLMVVAERIGTPIDSTFKTKARALGKPFDDYYDNETRALVAALYADDFRELGYAV